MDNQDKQIQFIHELNGNFAPELKVVPDLESGINLYLVTLYPTKWASMSIGDISQEAVQLIDMIGRKYFGESPKFSADHKRFWWL